MSQDNIMELNLLAIALFLGFLAGDRHLALPVLVDQLATPEIIVTIDRLVIVATLYDVPLCFYEPFC